MQRGGRLTFTSHNRGPASLASNSLWPGLKRAHRSRYAVHRTETSNGPAPRAPVAAPGPSASSPPDSTPLSDCCVLSDSPNLSAVVEFMAILCLLCPGSSVAISVTCRGITSWAQGRSCWKPSTGFWRNICWRRRNKKKDGDAARGERVY